LIRPWPVGRGGPLSGRSEAGPGSAGTSRSWRGRRGGRELARGQSPGLSLLPRSDMHALASPPTAPTPAAPNAPRERAAPPHRPRTTAMISGDRRSGYGERSNPTQRDGSAETHVWPRRLTVQVLCGAPGPGGRWGAFGAAGGNRVGGEVRAQLFEDGSRDSPVGYPGPSSAPAPPALFPPGSPAQRDRLRCAPPPARPRRAAQDRVKKT